MDEIAGLRNAGKDVPHNEKRGHLSDEPSTIENLAYVSSRPELLPLSIEENICMGHFEGILCEAARNLLETSRLIVDLEDRLSSPPSNLSTGQNARIGVLRAVHSGSEVLLFDEVASNLDSKNKAVFAQFAERLSEERLVIIATHEPSLFQNPTQVLRIEQQ